MTSRGRSNSCIGTPSPVFVPRHRRYSEDSLRLTHIRSQHNLQAAVSKTIINRLASYGVDTRAINKVTIEHCLPIDDDWVPWEEILNNPLGVSDATLSKMLRLRPVSGSPRISSKVKQNGDRTHVLYIRSFILKVHELREIIMRFHESGVETRTTLSWLYCINIMQPAQRVYVRYVGQTCRSGAVRFREDLLRWQRGFISKFFQVMGELYPHSLDSAAVYELQGSYLLKIAEQREQALIVLLGLPSLLNQRLWPVNLFTPNEAHEESFRTLGTRTIARLSISEFHPLRDLVALQDWAKKVQVYAETHPFSVCLWKNKVYPFSEALRQTIIEQGKPSAFQGKFVLFLVVGDRQTAPAYRNANAFFSKPSDTPDLLKGFLTRLWSWESDRPMNPARHDISRLIAAGAIPFVDLCPWLKAEGTDILEASHLLKEYALFVKPIIILSLAAKPSSVVASGFSHAFGYPQSCKFREKVGRLNLIHCGTGFCCIQIPCFHPGLARFSTNPETLAKILDMTLWILLLAISVVLDSADTFEGQSREDWCIYIKNTVEKTLNNRNFYSHYDYLKAQLHGKRPRWCSTTLNTRERSHLAVASLPIKDRFLMVGFAVDEPGFSRRRQQAWTLWHLNIPELHSHINRERKDDWFFWANNLTKGTSFLADASVSAILGTDATLALQERSGRQATGRPRKRQKLSQKPMKTNESITVSEGLHVPTDCDLVPSSIKRLLEDLSFKSSGPVSHQEAVGLVTSELSIALLPSQLVDACKLLEQEWGISRLARFQAQYQQSWNGAPVAIWRNSKFAIFWEDPNGQHFKFVLWTPSSTGTGQTLSSKGKFIFLYVVLTNYCLAE
ncbi:unnamed protein product [Penicillium nalgiovense]|nr:unnamed protein product [Penicillium nalgiovense]